MSKQRGYYIPKPSHWPIVGSIALFTTLIGAVNWLHGKSFGPYLFVAGLCLLVFMLHGWFGLVISENRAGLLADAQVERSYRWGMIWFIFTEVMLFATFFGVLFYAQHLSVPWLGGATSGHMTHTLLWPNFKAQWPLYTTPNPALFKGPDSVLYTWGIPAFNTVLLLSSGVTITIAHWAVLNDQRIKMLIAQATTILLGVFFISMQAYEYSIAYLDKGLKLSSGIYGSTFFMLTGFHALHVLVGIIMLSVIFWRMLKGDFSSQDHFGFEAVAWYWHFVDVVWLLLFVFVYWL